MNKRLLIVGTNSIHIENFIDLIKDYFDDILLLTHKKLENYKVPYKEIDFSIRKNGIKNLKNLKTIIKEFNPSIVHIHQVNTQALLTILALNQNTNTVLTAWGSDILIKPKKKLLNKLIVKYILKRVDIITADSDTVLNEAKKLVKNINSHNINFGIEVASCEIKKENIIYSNRLHNTLYNIDKIIISFSKFVKTNPSWKLIIAGSGNNTDSLKKLTQNLNIDTNVEFLGWLNAKENYENYCKSKIYVSIPSSDSVSLSLVEAIACNCIVFVSNLPANKEIITSEIGFIIDNKDNIDFDEFKKIDMEHYKKRREKIVKNFSKDYNKNLFIKIYGELLEKSNLNSTK